MTDLETTKAMLTRSRIGFTETTITPEGSVWIQIDVEAAPVDMYFDVKGRLASIENLLDN
jgi:hypothetical protein